MTSAPAISSASRDGARELDEVEAIWAELAQVAGEVNRANARLVEVTARAIASGAWFGVGIKSVEHWLVLRAGLDRGRAAVVVRLARRYAELPTTTAAFEAGRLSLEQAAAVSRHTPASHERAVAELAEHATVPQIVRATAQYPFPTKQPNPSPSSDSGQDTGGEELDIVPERPASLSMSTDADGRFRLRYEAPAHVGALVEAALRQAKDRLFQARHGHDANTGGPNAVGSYPHQVTLGDALAEICSAAVEMLGSPRRRERYRVLVHLDTNGAWLSGGPRLPQPVLAQLTCDGVLRPVWHTDGAPVNVGRGQRVVPQRTKALLRDRDRGCRFPGCPQAGSTAAHIEAHHLIHWLDGGRTNTDNLVSLCPWHHDRHHDGDFRISGNPDQPEHAPDGLRFTRPSGYPINPTPPPPPPAKPPRLQLVPDSAADAEPPPSTRACSQGYPTPSTGEATLTGGKTSTGAKTSTSAPPTVLPPLGDPADPSDSIDHAEHAPYRGPSGQPLHTGCVHFWSADDYTRHAAATAAIEGHGATDGPAPTDSHRADDPDHSSAHVPRDE